MYDFLVIGAGVVGALTARELTKYSGSVCVIDKENDAACGATKANSAIIHAGFDAAEGTLKAKLNVRGSKMMPVIAKELGVKYKNIGAIVAGSGEEQYEEVEKLLKRGIANGIEGLEIIKGERLREIEPSLRSEFEFALWAPTSSIICPYELAIAALGNAMDNGAQFIRGFEVKEISRNNGEYTVSNGKTEIIARNVINAAGIYADRIAKLAGDDSIVIHARRGEYLLLERSCGSLVNTTVFTVPTKMGKGILVSPTVDGNLLIGPTAENIEEKDDHSTTGEGIAAVIEKSSKMISDIPYYKVINSFTGLRAVGNTGDFIINSPFEGFFNIAGIESPGLSSAPAIAEYVVNMQRERGELSEKRGNFNPERKPTHGFKDLTAKEKNEIISHDPKYGRIICRCEGITEGEIVAAIHTNPGACDLDGIKRRTRSGMGPCQGGFCTPAIISILSRELAEKAEKITKKGGRSALLAGKTNKGGSDNE